MFRYVKKVPLRRTTVLMVKRTFAIENDKLKTEKKKESSIAQKLKDTVQRYGVIATMFHSTVYVSSLSTVYLGVSNGVDASALLSSWGLDPTIIPDGAGELAAAWAITAVTGPARAVGTVIGTPIVAGKYSKRRRSNVAVIIDRIVFVGSFLFYCLLCSHSFPPNPNKITNCLKLFSLLQLTTTLLLRRFLIFEHRRMVEISNKR
jgi:hypothetical protein